MKQGALIFDERTDRYDIRFDLADYYGGLHCGECFDVMIGGKWRPTRIEMAENWYLVGIRADDLSGLRGLTTLSLANCPLPSEEVVRVRKALGDNVVILF